MAQGFYGSICLEDLFQNQLVKGTNGKTYVCIDDLVAPPFNVGKNNGKHYVGIGAWLNDDIDQFGNIASISLTQSQQEREQQVKKTYIGNLRRSGGVATAASPVEKQTPTVGPAAGNLPF